MRRAPQPLDQLEEMTPTAPAASSAGPSPLRPVPVLATRSRHAWRAVSRLAFICSNDSSVAHSSQSASGRQVGCGSEVRTNLPFTSGSQAWNSVESATSPRNTTPAFTLPRVPGLQASIMPSSVRTRGSTRSMCVSPRSHPFHVPYCSLRAATPQRLYIATSQSPAA